MARFLNEPTHEFGIAFVRPDTKKSVIPRFGMINEEGDECLNGAAELMIGYVDPEIEEANGQHEEGEEDQED